MFKFNGTGTHFWLSEGMPTKLLLWDSASSAFALEGRTFGETDTGKQWFDQFIVLENNNVVLNVTVDNGKMMVWREGSSHPRETLDLLDFDLGGLKMKFNSARSLKSVDGKTLFLNVRFRSSLPAAARGLFSELAGLRPQTAATVAMLKNPHAELLQAPNCVCPPPSLPPPSPLAPSKSPQVPSSPPPSQNTKAPKAPKAPKGTETATALLAVQPEDSWDDEAYE